MAGFSPRHLAAFSRGIATITRSIPSAIREITDAPMPSQRDDVNQFFPDEGLRYIA
jgi:hypothetical protein